MPGNGLFATGFGAFGCFDGGIATNENGQNGAEGTTDRHNEKGVIQSIVMIYGAIHPFRASRLCPAFRAQLAAKPIT